MMEAELMTRKKQLPALLIGCLVYTIFVIYGSLVPLDFIYRPWNEALATFQNIRFLNLGIGSRADWVANILLFIPLTFLWAAFFHQNLARFRYVIALMILIIAAGLSVSIEFTQIFFPQRTVSINDIIAEITGAIAGLVIWRCYGHHFNTWFKRWSTNRAPAGRYEQLLYIYIAIIFGYNLLPLDLTNSPVEIYHKWVEGKIHIIPFFSSFEHGISSFLYGIFVDIIIWVPVSFLWILSAKKTLGQAFKWSWFSALLLEFLQIFVYSRVSDSADLITAALGAGLGVFFAKKYQPTPASNPIINNNTAAEKTALTRVNQSLTAPLALVAGWSVILFLVFWFPYDFRLEPQLIKERLPQLYRAPFSAYYYGTEFRAITSLLSKLAFFFPLGVLIAHLKAVLPNNWPSSLVSTFMALCLMGIAASVELGQILLPEKSIDSADILVAILGGGLGYFAYQFITGGHGAVPSSSRDPRQSNSLKSETSSKQQPTPILARARRLNKANHQHEALPQHSFLSSPWLLPVQWLIVALAFYLIENIAAIPYNVRELVSTSTLFERLIFASALLCAIWPLLFATRAYCTRHISGKQFSAIVILQPFILYGLLRLSVPLESIHDIVGYPVISTAFGLESMLRFAALYALPSWALISAVIVLLHPAANRLFACFFLGIMTLIIWHWVVVSSAATDNLTELFRDGGNWRSTLLLAGWFICLTTTLITALKIISGQSKHWLLALLAIAISFPLSYWVLNQALEIVIIKYDQVFSGLQFLLSPDRDHFVAEQDLLLRYFLAYFVLLTGLGWLGILATTCKLPKSTQAKHLAKP